MVNIIRWFEACSCKPTPRGLPSSSVQFRTLWSMVDYCCGVILIWVALDLLGCRPVQFQATSWQEFRCAVSVGFSYWGSPMVFSPNHARSALLHRFLLSLLFNKRSPRGYCLSFFLVLHCFPIAFAGLSAALVQRVLETSLFPKGGLWFRCIAGVAIICLGGYFTIQPCVNGILAWLTMILASEILNIMPLFSFFR